MIRRVNHIDFFQSRIPIIDKSEFGDNKDSIV